MSTPTEIIHPERKLSHIHLRLNISWAELQRQANNSIPQVLMDDQEFNEDGLKVHLEKVGELALRYRDSKLNTEIPLDVKVWYRYGKLGLYDVKEFRMKGTVFLSSTLDMRDFAIKTQTQIDKIVWKEDPKMMLFGKEVPVGFAVNPIVNKNAPKIAAAIDGTLEEQLNFKPQIEEQLKALQQPILLSDAYKMWFQATVVRIESTPLSLSTRKLELDVVLHAFLKTVLGEKPSPETTNNVLFRTTKEIKKEIDVHLPVETGYSELSELFTKQLKGKVIHDSKKPVVLDSIDVWHSEGKLIIATQLSGRVKGWLYLRGVPKFNQETQEIFLDELDYHMNTKNALVKTLNWMLSGKILRLMQENARYSIKKDLDDLKKEMTQQLNNYSPFEGTKLKFSINELKFIDLKMSDSGLRTNFQLLANLVAMMG